MINKKAFIKIDEQGWYCHFRTESPHPILNKVYWKLGCTLLIILKRFKSVDVINTFNGDSNKVTNIQ